MDTDSVESSYRDKKGHFVKGFKANELPIEMRIKKATSMSESWKNNDKYIGDLKNKYPKLFNSWRSMLYTEKGKKAGTSEEWKDFKTFVQDVAPTYKKGLLFRRLDSKKPFSKTNFMWCTKEEATMLHSNLCWLEYRGEILTLKQISDKYNVSLCGLKTRYHNRNKKGYTVDEIVFGRKTKRGSKEKKDFGDDGVHIRAKASKMISSYKNKDKKNGLDVSDMDIDWLTENILTKPCVYCGDTHKVGCDRIDNNKGHSKENVVPCCFECNTARNNNFSFEEMKEIGLAIREVKIKRGINLLENNIEITNNGRKDGTNACHITYQFSLEKEFIAKFNSVKQAAESVDGTPKALSAAAMGKNYKGSHKYKGFLWSHDSNQFNNPQTRLFAPR